MPVELRKRKAPQPPSAPAPATKRAGKVTSSKAVAPKPVKKAAPAASAKKTVTSDADEDKSKDDIVADEDSAPDAVAAPTKTEEKNSAKIGVGDVLDLNGFGGEIETNDGHKTSLKNLVDECSGTGVVIFTYPKASTPGCTNQACLFRDAYESLLDNGLSIYGLSTDSPKANTSFKEKQKLPYSLLCDPHANLIAAIGFKKQPKGTQRGVFAIDTKGKVLVAEPGGPAATVDRIKELVAELKAR